MFWRSNSATIAPLWTIAPGFAESCRTRLKSPPPPPPPPDPPPPPPPLPLPGNPVPVNELAVEPKPPFAVVEEEEEEEDDVPADCEAVLELEEGVVRETREVADWNAWEPAFPV